MISREEAIKRILENTSDESKTIVMNEVFDSITKCGECRFSENIMLGELKYAKCSLFPSEGNVDIFELEEFCSKGEPR